MADYTLRVVVTVRNEAECSQARAEGSHRIIAQEIKSLFLWDKVPDFELTHAKELVPCYLEIRVSVIFQPHGESFTTVVPHYLCTAYHDHVTDGQRKPCVFVCAASCATNAYHFLNTVLPVEIAGCLDSEYSAPTAPSRWPNQIRPP